jgi:hypothetical protein
LTQLREVILRSILAFSETWPDIVALWSGMVKQLIDDGWTEQAARALVLSSVTTDNAALLAVFPDAFETEEEEGKEEDGTNP